MLQSPNNRIQRQRRLTNTSGNPILEAKQDNKRRITRPQPNGSALQRTHPVHQAGPRKQQHRRHLSVPDNLLMMAATSKTAQGALQTLYPARTLNDTDFGVENDDVDRQQHLTSTNNNINNFFLQSNLEQERPHTPPNYGPRKYYPVTPQTPYSDFAHGPEDAAQLIDDLISMESLTPNPSRRGSAVGISSPLRATVEVDKSKGLRQAPYTPQQNTSLPTPPHTVQMQSVSTFDLAPLPPTNFINLAALNIPTEDTLGGKSHPSSIASLDSPQMLSSSDIGNTGLFETAAMPAVPEHSAFPMSDPTEYTACSSPEDETDLFGQDDSPDAEGIPIGSEYTGITMDEIASFISGPEQSDGKWVCLFPECNKRFGRKENIKSHVQTHLGDRQYRCEICRKCFVRQHDLKRHAKIHTGIKPYPCLCGHSFARHDALTRHRQRGFCIGAFEGVVRKVAKRGRPRKRPLKEGEESQPSKKRVRQRKNSSSDEGSSSSSVNSSSASEASDPRTPYQEDFSSPLPPYPEDCSSPPSQTLHIASSSTSVREASLELPHHSTESDGYSPPTSPPEFIGGLESFVADANRNSMVSSSLPDEDFLPDGLDYSEFTQNTDSFSSQKFDPESIYSDDYSSPSSQEGFFFSQEQSDILGLSALERDPTILSFDDICIKPENLALAGGGSA